MTTPSSKITTTQPQQGDLVAQDTTQQLQRLFTGHLVGQPATGNLPLLATVTQVTSVNGFPAVVVTLDGFGENAAFQCYFEKRFYWNGSANVEALPPTGIPCVVVFPKNDPQNVGFALAFLGWPTE